MQNIKKRYPLFLSLAKTVTLFLWLAHFTVFSQSWCDRDKDAVVERLYHVVEVLSHDSLKGREAGTEEDVKAAKFIADIFHKIGLQSILPNNEFLQGFSFTDGITFSNDNALKINGKDLRLVHDFYPLNISASTQVEGEVVRVGYGISASNSGYDDYLDHDDIKGKIFAMLTGMPSQLEGSADASYNADIETKVSEAYKRGAAGVIFLNLNDDVPLLFRDMRFRQSFDIPVVVAEGKAVKMIMDAPVVNADIFVSIERNVQTSYNVVGYLDNKALKTIVIGGHFDHLGMGSPISRHKGPPEIHPGADDNASGISVLIELARRFICEEYKTHNILFVAFGAEEKGLLGSNYFVNSNAYELSSINYMLNIDMIGRIDSIDGKLTIIGTGSSNLWDSVIDITKSSYFSVRKSTSATGGSDHANFYLKDIPALFFFTGLHEDYHAPGDVISKLNFLGIFHISNYIFDFIISTQGVEIPFSKAPADNMRRSRRSTNVAMGIMPDHAYENAGVRVADVTENGPAHKAGILRGDIIFKIGLHDIKDIHSYMNALGAFNKGSKTLVEIIRDEDLISLELEF